MVSPAPIARLVERHVEEIGRVGGLVARPADREGHARLRRLARSGARDIEPVAAPFHGRGDARGARPSMSTRPVGDAARRSSRARSPSGPSELYHW